MFVIKTETYKFPNHAEAQAYYDYFIDKYEVGGAEVEKCYRNGMTELSFSYIVDTDQDEDFVKYKIKNYKNTLDK